MKINILDHGYVEFIEAYGTGKSGRKHGLDRPIKMHMDENNVVTGDIPMSKNDYEVGIIEAARMSTSGAFKGWESDAKLLAYLYDHKHNTPFEFAGMVIEVQAPIMVFREWQRHRTQSYNEMSARYIPLPPLYYHPHVDEIIERAKTVSTNKQANSVAEVKEAEIIQWVANDLEYSNLLEQHYQHGLRIGVPKELARKKMPVDHYSRMRCAANLRNWLAFMTLRCDMNAQKEIRLYADAVVKIIASVFPHTHTLWSTEFYA